MMVERRCLWVTEDELDAIASGKTYIFPHLPSWDSLQRAPPGEDEDDIGITMYTITKKDMELIDRITNTRLGKDAIYFSTDELDEEEDNPECIECEKIGRIHDLKEEIEELREEVRSLKMGEDLW
jgi:hypothetical protein